MENLERAARESAEETMKAARDATDSATKAAQEAAQLSIRALEESIGRAQSTGDLARVAAETSIKAFEELINKTRVKSGITNEPGQETVEGAKESGIEQAEVTQANEQPPESSIRVFREAIKRTGAGEATEKKQTDRPKKDIDARLEFLARMYEKKRTESEESSSSESVDEED